MEQSMGPDQTTRPRHYRASPVPAGRRCRGKVQTIREANELLVLNCLRERQPTASIEIARTLGFRSTHLRK